MVTKVFSGYISDAVGKRKPLVLIGYGLAAASKPLFPLASSVAAVATARLIDRFGKGIRGAPRDALVGELAPPSIRGACFGLRQSMDTVGAVLGPLLAMLGLWLLAGNLRAVLWIAVVPAVVCVVLLVVAVPEPDHETKPARLPITREGFARLGVEYWRLVALGGVIALARFSEAFLVLRASGIGLPLPLIPLVLVVMSVVYTFTAYPVGKLSDRMPRHVLLALGMLVLAAADAVLAIARGNVALFAGIALWGLHMGMTQGLLATLVADTTPVAYRGTAFGVFNLVSGIALLAASAAAGALWDAFGPWAAFAAGGGLCVVSAVLALRRPVVAARSLP
jgi:MFS family permease